MVKGGFQHFCKGGRTSNFGEVEGGWAENGVRTPNTLN